MDKPEKPVNNTNEELDLGYLFKILGDAFNRFFNFIGNLFKKFFNTVILFLLFIQRHFLQLVAAAVIGFLIGFYIEYSEGSRYESTMMVEPNFNSVQQLYNNIAFYNEMAESDESQALATALNISEEDASAIEEIKVESVADENQKIKLFDEFIRELDSNTIKSVKMESYLSNFNSFDARFHKIIMTTTKSNVAKKTQGAIVNSIKINNYFRLQKEVSDRNISIQDSIYRRQMVELDSLQQLYNKVMLLSAKNPFSGTQINMAKEEGTPSTELQLIKQRSLIQEELIQLYEDKASKSSIINVISDFPDRGVKVRGLYRSKKFLGALGGIALTFLFFCFLELNLYLKKYKQKLS